MGKGKYSLRIAVEIVQVRVAFITYRLLPYFQCFFYPADPREIT